MTQEKKVSQNATHVSNASGDSDQTRAHKAKSSGAQNLQRAKQGASNANARTAQSANRNRRRRGNKTRNKHTESYKHVDYEHHRPQLAREGNGYAGSAYRGGVQDPHYRFDTPDKDPKATLKVIPLGGLDAIGKNMTVFECNGDIVLDDAGLMFPDDDHPGIDLILPDYTYVLENCDRLRGIVITHGHEDHTGCLPYLLKDLDMEVPIYGTKLTLGLIEGKFKEHRVKNAKLIEINPGDEIHLGCFTLDFFSVNHSIPGALGIFFRSPAGNVLHTGDFKLDQTPIDGIHTDFAALSRFSEIGVDLLMSDSTNATVKEFTKSEAVVGGELRRIIAGARGKVVIASFASHIHRMQQICDAAIENGRKVVVTGRSMIQNTDIARRLGYLHIDDDDLIDAYDLKGIDPSRVVVMCTGSQGEPLSALARIASGEHKTVRLDEGDTVIISASPVPGNEKAVTNLVNLLAKVGADVWDKKRACVHVSGHGGSEELKIMLSIVKPRAFMPVHGEAMHLLAHARLGEQTGVPHDNIFILDNGDTLEISSAGVRIGESVPSGIVLVDGLSVGDTSSRVLDERTELSAQGFATVVCGYDAISKRMVGKVQVEMHGITGGDDYSLIQEAQEAIQDVFVRELERGKGTKELRRSIKNTLASILWSAIKQKPMIIVSVLEV